MLDKFNRFIEKWMALVTPACLLFGVLFPDIAKHGLPYVSLVFAFMTFTGALKLDFHDMARVLNILISLLACLGVLHVLLPVLACGLGHLLFPGNDRLITGMVLEFLSGGGGQSYVVMIYSGNSPLSLSLVIVHTFCTFPDPGHAADFGRFPGVHGCSRYMMRELLFMIAIPALAAMSLNELTRGKVRKEWPSKLVPPFSKMCLIFVVASNSSKVAPYVRNMTPQRVLVAAAILVLGGLRLCHRLVFVPFVRRRPGDGSVYALWLRYA